MTRSASAVRPRVQVRTAAAALISAPRCVTLLHRPLPQPGPGQVRVRLGSCGVCASSLPVWQGRRWFEYPRQAGAPGHEGCGVVEAVGDGVPASRIGERVALLSYHAFATHDVAPASHAIRLPRSLEGRLFPGEALGCAMNIFRRAGVRRGDRVAIVGAGFLGALLTQLAARAGASVAAFSRRPSALRMSEAMGAEDACLVDGEQACRRDEAFDIVIECTGHQAPLDLAASLVRERGRLIIAGFHQDGPRTVDMQSWNWRGIDVINAHEREPSVYIRGIREAAEAVASGRLDPDPLYTHVYPLQRLAEALDAADRRPDGFMKAIVTMEAA